MSQDLEDGPVRDPLSVGKATPRDDLDVDPSSELGDEARLADSRLSQDGHELAPVIGMDALPGFLQELEFAPSPYEERLGIAGGLLLDLEQAVGRDGLFLPLEGEWRERLDQGGAEG